MSAPEPNAAAPQPAPAAPTAAVEETTLIASLPDGKKLVMKNKLTVKQVKDARHMMGEFINFRESLTKADEAGLTKLQGDIMQKTEQQDLFMLNCLEYCYGVTVEDLDKMEYLAAVLAFSDAYKMSTELPKKSGVPYA